MQLIIFRFGMSDQNSLPFLKLLSGYFSFLINIFTLMHSNQEIQD